VPDESFLFQVKRLLVGAPIPSHQAHHERLSRITGLAILSSDALSSVAYATEEILRVLLIGGAAALGLVTPIGLVIAITLAIVAFSYRQTIYAYPSGGGAYLVAKDNLGRAPSLIAAASLLIDYVLTVAVSVAAGVAAITSAIPGWGPYRVEVALAFILLLTVGNLRGVRESGRIFAVPTYFFIVSILGMLAVGAWRSLTGTFVALPPHHDAVTGSGALTTFVLLTAFSNGCTLSLPKERRWSRKLPGLHSGDGTSSISPCRPQRCRSWCWRRTRRMRIFRGSHRSWLGIAFCRVNS
jgi:amino acid transporter